jgi:general secretion pathway protein C
MLVPSRGGRRTIVWRLPPHSAVELVLLTLVAAQSARLVLALVTPLGPIGEWSASSVRRAAPPTHILGSFDPFFRLARNEGPITVTSLDLQLFGVREDRATGRGSAIIGSPGGEQRSFTVGEEILPGVTLVSVGFDHVSLSRGGAEERLFLNQPGAAAPTAAEAQHDDVPDGPGRQEGLPE